jgi:hypothetical protein
MRINVPARPGKGRAAVISLFLPVGVAAGASPSAAATPADVVTTSLAFFSQISPLASMLAGGAVVAAIGAAVVARRDGPTAVGRTADGLRPQSRAGMVKRGDVPRSDIGTVLLHWIVAAAMVASLLTGLRISADAPDAVISRFLSPILPQGEVWTVHFTSSLALIFTTTAYILYMARGGLKRRVSLKKLRVFTLPTAPRVRWGAANVALYWAFYGVLLILTATGIALYWGFGGWIVAVHAVCAFITIGYVVAHLVVHFGYGGWQQILRIFRPTRLVPNRATRTRPLLVATAIAVPAAIALASYDIATRDVLTVTTAARAPKLDGVLDDEAWRAARPVFVRTMQGSGLGGTGESTVEIRAIRDDKNIYFAFRWEDPSRSLRRLPLIKREDGWHILGDNPDTADVTTFYEDKFAIMFSRSDAFGNGGSTHMGPRPLADKPAPLNRRGFHYTTDGRTIDMWQWKASRGGLLGYVDDMYMSAPTKPTQMEAAGRGRYQGGYWGDPGQASYTYNFKIEPGHKGPAPVVRLPKDLAANAASIVSFSDDPDSIDAENARWWMTPDESVPYTPELDAGIPLGTVIPGVIIPGDNTGDRAHVHGGAKWKDGYWTLETTRALATGSQYDIDFTTTEPLYVWVSVFDHNQTRHTRHMRPVRLETR